MAKGRPKKSEQAVAPVPAEGEAEQSATPSAILDLDIPGMPPAKIDGEWNVDYFATLVFTATKRYYTDVLVDKGKSDFNIGAWQKFVMDGVKLVGLTERDVIDRRTEAQRAEDVYKLIAADPESIFGIPTEDLQALDRVLALKCERMDTAEQLVYQEIEGLLVGEEDARADRDKVGKAGREVIGGRSPKDWRRRIALVLRLRQRAKSPVPPGCSSHGGWQGNQHTQKSRPNLIAQAMEAAHPMRFMIYTGRSGMDQTERFAQKSRTDPSDLIFDIGPHHARFCAHLWMHRNGVRPTHDRENDRYFMKPGMIHYRGSVQVMAIGHGKTEIAIHLAGLEMGLRPRTTGLYLHAKEDNAAFNLAHIKRFFDPKDGIGQRYLSMFPCRLTKKHNDGTHIRLDVKNPPKSHTFTAAGVDSKNLGIDADFQIWDDVVPQSDAEQPTERERRTRTLRGTFLSRKRSKNAFTLIIGTLWHYGDSLMSIIGDAKKAAEGRDGLCYGVLVQRCGGPKATERTREWQSLWPSRVGLAQLKEKYAELGPSLYSAAMMANPVADEQRIVKKLRLYDPTTPEHASFLANSVKHISLDPAATNTATSDKAGIVYGGMGDVRTTKESEGLLVQGTEKRFRVLDYREIHATQSDLTDYTTSFALHQPVDYVLVEAVSGFKGIVEMFRGNGIDAIPMSPRGKNKEQRLRAVAPILEDANVHQGVRAVCEFPAEIGEDGKAILDNHGRMRIDPKCKGLAEQVIDYGVCAADHGLDALTQVLGYLSPDLAIGRGIVSEQAQRIETLAGDPRMRAIVKRIMGGGDDSGSIEEDENKWITRNWS